LSIGNQRLGVEASVSVPFVAAGEKKKE